MICHLHFGSVIDVTRLRDEDGGGQPGRLDPRELHAWRSYVQMQELLRARIEQQLQECSGLSMADYTVLVVLSEVPDDQLRTFELVDLLGWEKSRVHHQLTRMCQRGLVERRSAGSRAVTVSITGHGRTTLEQAAPRHSAHVRQLVFDVLSPEQVDQLADVSTTILAKLSDNAQPPGSPESAVTP